MKHRSDLKIRRANLADESRLRSFQGASLRILGAAHYERAALESFIRHRCTMDACMLTASTFFMLEVMGELAGCGGWSVQDAAYDCYSDARGENRPGEQVTVRSIYVDPAFARQGLATRIMELVEGDIRAAGFTGALLTSSLTGLPLYQRLGYKPSKLVTLHLPDGHEFPGIAMSKPLTPAFTLAA